MIIALGLTLLCQVLFNNPLLPLLVSLLFIASFSNQKILIGLLIISYLSISSEYFENIRGYVTLLSTFLLLILFLKEYGLQIGKYPKVPNEILAFLVLLILTLTVSTIFSHSVIISALATLRTLVFLSISYLFYALLRNEHNINIYIFSIFGVVLIIGIPMIIDLYSLGIQNYFIRSLLADKFDIITSRGYTRLTILFISISLITAMFFKNNNKNIINKILLIILLMFNIVTLILANSRGGILAAIISMSFILFMLKRPLFIKTFLVLSAAVVFLIITVPTFNEAVNFYIRWETVSDREVYWQMGLDVIKDNPIHGIGPDLFDKYFFDYAPSKTINHFKPDFLTLGKPHPHNFFLYFMAENGILGLITAVVFFVVFFYIAFRTMRLTKRDNRNNYILTIAITGIGIGIFFRSFIEVTGYLIYGYITMDLPFWLIFGILISIYQKYSKSYDSKLYAEKLK